MKKSSLGRWEKHTIPILSADEIDNSDDDDGIINQETNDQENNNRKLRRVTGLLLHGSSSR